MAATRILLTHTPDMRRNLYGERALAGLRAVGEVTLHEGAEPLAGQALAEAARGCQLIVADRNTRGDAIVFENSPELVAFLRVAVDIRNIDVAAASSQGVLVTRASPGFVTAVTELVLGFLVDLSRGVSRASAEYHEGRAATVVSGRQLQGATLGVIGYGAIGKRVAAVGAFLGMRVLVSDPEVKVTEAGMEQVTFEALLEAADYVVCLAIANEQTENLMNDAAFARMKRGACFVNVSRGNLVDEAALARALDSGHLAGAAMDVGRAADQKPSVALARRSDVIATPHIAGTTPQAIEHQALETVEQAAEIVQGRAPRGAVNAAQASRLARLAR
jgi:D-3-phosphoglycerate dehydrogenase / 2-oxoglutarate reductase